jgi:antitoxin component YwqK of YwqJK toxin-antitoxin module
MKKFILVAGLFFSLLSFGQKIERITYLDSTNNIVDSVKYAIKRVVYKLDNNKYLVEEFKFSNIKESAEEVLEIKNFSKDGISTYYFDNGNIKSKYNYKEGVLNGFYEKFYENGKIKETGFYLEKNIKKIDNYWTVTGLQKVTKGNGTYSFEYSQEENNIVFSGQVIDGLYEGKWTTQKNIYPYWEETYEKGELMEGIYFESKQIIKKYKSVFIMSEPPKGMYYFRQSIAQKLSNESNIKGKVIIKFYINHEGKITNPIISKNKDKYLKHLITDLLSKERNWSVAYLRGKPYNCYFDLPLNFGN